MKKLTAIIAAAALAVTPAMAEVDLTGMSYDDLVTLQQQVTKAIMMTNEWQEVTVPAGVYVVGREIPAGRWHIEPVAGSTGWAGIGYKINDAKTELAYPYTRQVISHPNASYYEYNKVSSVDYELENGMYVVLEGTSFVFTPYSGPSFTFK